MKSVVLFCCKNLNNDRVAPYFLERIKDKKIDIASHYSLGDITVSSFHSHGIDFHLAELSEVLSHNYERYATTINANFSHFDLGVIINWHQGANAPNAIFCIQTTGDLETGTFSSIRPELSHALYESLSLELKKEKLDFIPWFEASHWSGTLFRNQNGDMVKDIILPLIDFEIGSSPEDWTNLLAHDVMISSVLNMGKFISDDVVTILGVGGTHFDTSLNSLSAYRMDGKQVVLSHLLANQWLVSYEYNDRITGVERYKKIMNTVSGGIDYVVFKDKLKSDLKNNLKIAAEELGIECISHKAFRKKMEAQP